MTVRITVQAQHEVQAGYASYVQVTGSKHACASFWAGNKQAARKAAVAYCAKYNLTVTK